MNEIKYNKLNQGFVRLSQYLNNIIEVCLRKGNQLIKSQFLPISMLNS